MSSDESTSASASEVSLADSIVASYVKSKISTDREQKYLPEGSINRLITASSIRAELSDISLEGKELDLVVDFIVTRARKVFTIAVLAQLGGLDLFKAIKTFHDVGLDDDNLPILADRDADLVSLAFKPRRLWNSVRKERFFEDQWGVVVRVFTKQQLRHSLEESSILPLERVSDAFKGGTFGDVYEATVHRSHMDDILFKQNGRRTNVAVKEIKASQLLQDDVQKAYNIEALALSRISKVEHEHLTPCFAAIEKGSMHYFLFPWADAGSLEDFWQGITPVLSRDFVMEILEQLRGLSAALEKLHGYNESAPSQGRPVSPGSSGGIRHGDLKPGNILIFKSSSHPKGIGTMKIGDMGLARYHQVQTRLRRNLTNTRYGTSRYEPPEVGAPKLTSPAMSRLYDTWSMGCIFLEFLIWLLHGNEALASFNHSIHEYNIKNQQGSMYDLEPPYYVVGGDKKAEVHPLVLERLGELSRHPNCRANTALGDLLRIVKTKLLVVELPSGGEAPSRWVSMTTTSRSGPSRATAQILRESLDYIIGKAKKDSRYLFTERNKDHGRAPSLLSKASSSSLHPDSAYNVVQRIKQLARPMTQMRGNLDIHVWDFSVDNDFASQVLDAESPALDAALAATEKLCDGCRDLDILASGFHIEDELAVLKSRESTCQFCSMRWEACKHLDGDSASARFDRVDSVMKLNESDPPVFSICSPGFDPSPSVQMGLPQVSESSTTPYQSKLINTWLRECDENHPKCKGIPNKDGPSPRKPFQLPTRLIDIGEPPGFKIKLYETQPGDKIENLRYVALSHQWGDPNASNHFRTTTKNYAAHLSNMDLYKLPSTFKDAVIVARDIGIRYLWIDSICIIQGPDGDFNTESQKMEDVFSSAYCVIAASCARDQWDGFLKDRPSSSRRFATFNRGRDSPLYVCQFLDDFNMDVLEGPLSKRGWVLQERVLARRSIFFTDTQIYWECGDGVRCETLTHMKNELAAFLGDPNFPQAAIHSERADRETSRGEKILYYQDLYKTYSKLAFSKPEDRSVAMNGLEQRLSRGFNCRGKFGILDDRGGSLFHRSLLWHRPSEGDSMSKISFPSDRQEVPSWSWMAYQGEIDYLPVPFDAVDWERSLQSPLRGYKRTDALEIRARANRLSGGHELEPFYDMSWPEGSTSEVLCVIVGRTKGVERIEDKVHYILLICPKASDQGAYERIGAGKVSGSWIDFTRSVVEVGIC
ncbi:hypothetical protein ACJ41O_014824 [Fusarium nematophilum]